MKDLSQKLRVDAILVYTEGAPGSGGVDTSIWSFERPEMTTKFALRVFYAKAGRFILDQPGLVVLKLGSSQPPEEEIQNLVATSVVDKFLDYLKPKAAAKP